MTNRESGGTTPANDKGGEEAVAKKAAAEILGVTFDALGGKHYAELPNLDGGSTYPIEDFEELIVNTVSAVVAQERARGDARVAAVIGAVPCEVTVWWFGKSKPCGEAHDDGIGRYCKPCQHRAAAAQADSDFIRLNP